MMSVGPRKTAFLVHGADRVGALTRILDTLAQARINMTAMNAVTAGGKRFGAIFWVRPKDVGRASRVGVKGWLRHLRSELIEAALKRCNVGKFVHEVRRSREPFANCASRPIPCAVRGPAIASTCTRPEGDTRPPNRAW